MGGTKRGSGWSSSPLSLQRRWGVGLTCPGRNGTTPRFGSSFPSRYSALISAIIIMTEGRGRNRVEQWGGPVALSLKYK